MIKSYIQLTKPGILCGNAVTMAGGYALASKGEFDLLLFTGVFAGLILVMASGCVFNNYIDREIDQKMKRTQKRALAKGQIQPLHAQIFGSFLGALGFLTLYLTSNVLSLALSALGFFVYVPLYSLLKYRTRWATLVGSISGAIPAVVGYCAVKGRFDSGAWLLLGIMILWQMPHFYAIAMYRLEEYRAASIPVLPLVRGMQKTKIQMLLYVIGFALVAVLPSVLGYTGKAYLTVSALLGIVWLVLTVQGFKSCDDKRWARKMFLFSLITITCLFTALSLDPINESSAQRQIALSD